MAEPKPDLATSQFFALDSRAPFFANTPVSAGK